MGVKKAFSQKNFLCFGQIQSFCHKGEQRNIITKLQVNGALRKICKICKSISLVETNNIQTIIYQIFNIFLNNMHILKLGIPSTLFQF